jgi:hypothetical protein
VALKLTKPVETQYVLLWLTELPQTNDGKFRGRVADISVKS